MSCFFSRVVQFLGSVTETGSLLPRPHSISSQNRVARNHQSTARPLAATGFFFADAPALGSVACAGALWSAIASLGADLRHEHANTAEDAVQRVLRGDEVLHAAKAESNAADCCFDCGSASNRDGCTDGVGAVSRSSGDAGRLLQLSDSVAGSCATSTGASQHVSHLIRRRCRRRCAHAPARFASRFVGSMTNNSSLLQSWLYEFTQFPETQKHHRGADRRNRRRRHGVVAGMLVNRD